jgi:hypothetical protein
VDLMVISSCPPDVSNPRYYLPDGRKFTFDDMGPLMARMKGSGRRVMDDNVKRYAAWLGVPVAHSAACGTIDTAIPNGRGSLLTMLPLAPQLIKHWSQANRLRLTCDLIDATQIVDANGAVLSAATDHVEGYALATVTLPEAKPRPIGPRPPRAASWLTYFASDVALPGLMRGYYRRRNTSRLSGAAT